MTMGPIAKHNEGGTYMKDSWIFSDNDVANNLTVILAGLLVDWTGSNYPDPVIGGLVEGIELNGPKRILTPQG